MNLKVANRIMHISSRPVSFQFPEKFKGTIVEKLKNYVVQIKNDYTEVLMDSLKTMRGKPLKSSIYGSLAFSLYYCCKNNPDEASLNEQLISYEQDLSMVAVEMHNKKSTEYLKYLEGARNEGILRRFSIGFASFLWISDYNPELASYKATCEHLQPQYLKFHERIIDIGFLNKFWKLDNKMKNYDINY